MLKKTMKYTDFLGEEVTEEFYFHLTEADIIELEVAANGNSLSAWVQKISREENGAELVEVFKKIIAVSYGVKSVDGRRFIKSPEIFADFKSTQAYSDLFTELASNAPMATEFINGIVPASMSGNPQAQAALNSNVNPAEAARQRAEEARRRSEEAMQGHRTKLAATTPAMEKQDDLPVELETAPPVLEAASPNASGAKPDFDKMTREELVAYYKNQA